MTPLSNPQRLFLLPVPALFIAYAWTIEYHVHIAAPLIILFLLGLSTIWIYSSLLAYIVDSNPGQSSSAVACNSLFRGVLACVASQAAEPIIGGVGDGIWYTIVAVLLLVGEGGVLLVGAKGEKWRGEALRREAEKEKAAEGV